jgi:hypothetical protein
VPLSSALGVALAATASLALVWAGSSKLRDPFPASVAMVRFGVARRVRRVNGRMVGALEIVAGACVLGGPASVWPYAVATALFIAFAVLVGRALMRGQRFSCACFGSDASTVINVYTLLRPVVLGALMVAGLVLTRAQSPSVLSLDYLDAFATGALVAAGTSLVAAVQTTQPFGA